MSDLVNHYLEEQFVGDKTKEDRRRNLENLRKFSGKPLREIKRSDVQKWLKYKRDEKGVKQSSLNQYLSNLKDFYDWLFEETLDSVELKEKLKEYLKIKEINRRPPADGTLDYHGIDQIRKLLDNIEQDYRVKFFTICYYFGLRRDEARLLESKDVDFNNRKIKIRREITKTPSGERELPFHPKMKKYLESEGKYVIGHETQDGGYTCYCKSTFFWDDLTDVLGFQVKNRQLRRTFNRHMLSKLSEEIGEDAEYLTKKLMGHKTKNTDMTLHHMGDIKNEWELKRKAMEEWHYLLGEGIL